MTWRNITILACDKAASKQVQKARAALADRATGLAQSRVELDEKLASLVTSDLSNETLQALENARNLKVASWQTEISLRDDYQAYLSDYGSALRALMDEALREKQAVEDQVRTDLEKIGYVVEETDDETFVPITPEFLMRNSRVRKMRFRIQDIDGFQNQVHNTTVANEEARRLTKEEMDRYVTSVLQAVMGPGWSPAAVA